MAFSTKSDCQDRTEWLRSGPSEPRRSCPVHCRGLLPKLSVQAHLADGMELIRNNSIPTKPPFAYIAPMRGISDKSFQCIYFNHKAASLAQQLCKQPSDLKIPCHVHVPHRFAPICHQVSEKVGPTLHLLNDAPEVPSKSEQPQKTVIQFQHLKTP